MIDLTYFKNLLAKVICCSTMHNRNKDAPHSREIRQHRECDCSGDTSLLDHGMISNSKLAAFFCKLIDMHTYYFMLSQNIHHLVCSVCFLVLLFGI